MRPPSSVRTEFRLPTLGDLGLIELTSRSGLRAQFLPSGALFALRHQATLINQVLPGPAEEGLFRLLLRVHGEDGRVEWTALTAPGRAFRMAGAQAVRWTASLGDGLSAETAFVLHADEAGWCWRIHVTNTGKASRRVDVLHAQDLGLADEAAVRNNEAYTSQYIDLLPVHDPRLGWVILARQNQPAAGGRHPWLAVGCAGGASAFCTDGAQFFGADHRLTGEAAALREPSLASRRSQQEFALAGLQSAPVDLAPGESTEFVFVVAYRDDQPGASESRDVHALHRLVSDDWAETQGTGSPAGDAPESLFVTAPWQHGDAVGEEEWAAWFPGAHRHVERSVTGELLSFFCDEATHVVSRAKEATVARPHGHVLRSGDGWWIDDAQFGVTCYAAGVFAAQAYLGNPSFARLLPVVRNALNVTRASGQRIFLRREGAWRQLGIPSAFVLSPGLVRWIYRLGDVLLEVRVGCMRTLSAAVTEIEVVVGEPQEFLVTHTLVAGTAEFEHGGTVRLHAEGWAAVLPAADSLVGRQAPGVAFAIVAGEAETIADVAGDALIYSDGRERGGPYLTLRTKPVSQCAVLLLGIYDGATGLPGAVATARRVWREGTPAAVPPGPPVRLARSDDVAVSRVNEILPWYAQNACIHFSAPHGLEQYGGAAWGVRDVCQGSLEWLLASGEFGVARRMLANVFAQQYAHDGSWPQWFMHPPYRFIQQAHSHGDVCFWPVKALCDYVEATNDLAFLEQPCGYTDAQRFEPTGPEETLWAHCDRVVEHVVSRFVGGTALVNYGDGDWDDTLQPADPAMRTRMISAWTVALAYQTFRQLAEVSRKAGEPARAERLEALLQRMRRDFVERLMPGGVVAGFLVTEDDGRARPLLHPEDNATGIRYRLLPMTRSILADLFTPEQAAAHLEIVARELRCPDGVRLMSEPATYRGGIEHLFKRADTAANVGREIGLQYVHAHLRYAEALAKVGDADRLWEALQVVNPVGLGEVVPNAAPRQSNVYFSSSDAAFEDRQEAAARWQEVRDGTVVVRGGWRLYSSGPGLFLHKVRACLLGVRESFGEVTFDPVLPLALDGLTAWITLAKRTVELRFRVRARCYGPVELSVNGQPVAGMKRERNPYRVGGFCVPLAELDRQLSAAENIITIEL